MKRGLLLVLMVWLGVMMACGQKVPYMVKIEEDTYMDNTEMSIEAWIEYDWDISKQYGEDSPERRAVVPDNRVFRSLYGKDYEAIKKYLELKDDYRRCPIVGLSREQIVKYCEWRTEKCAQRKEYHPHGRSLVFGLPDKNDYESALSKAKVTKKVAGAPNPKKKGGKIYGLYDNVSEMRTDVTPQHPYGFRCVAREVE
ncbi:MAG: hypothetical protein J5526_03775 [Bacteroidales bacterium]|nr:hypothetical protein [Bacteroidales bacterium]